MRVTDQGHAACALRGFQFTIAKRQQKSVRTNTAHSLSIETFDKNCQNANFIESFSEVLKHSKQGETLWVCHVYVLHGTSLPTVNHAKLQPARVHETITFMKVLRAYFRMPSTRRIG